MADETAAVTPDEELGKLTSDLHTLLNDRSTQWYSIVNLLSWDVLGPVMAATAIYSKAFLETLAKHHADAFSVAVRTRFRKNGETREALIGPGDGRAATLVVTASTPDEARLALLDLDVTAEDVRGKVLRWDSEAMAWRPDSADG